MTKTSSANDGKPIPLEHSLRLLETIEENPQVTQADLATQLGVAVGTVNWYLKRLIGRGYIKIRRMQRRRLLYLITPRGISEKSRLGVRFAQSSLQLYRDTRAQSIELLQCARSAGYAQVGIEGNGDLAEICRLTCLEQGMLVVDAMCERALPILQVDGARIKLVMPESSATL